MIPKVLNNTVKEKFPKLILITPAWTAQVWCPRILSMSIESPILLPWRKELLKNLKGEISLLVQNNISKLAMLVALTSASHALDLQHLNISFMGT